MADLQETALELALSEYAQGVREEAPNWSPRIAEYIANLDPPLDFPIPWCAAFVQFCSDEAAQRLQVDNPLDGVRREAYVADYVSWAEENYLMVAEAGVLVPGDLIVFSFGGERYDHIGFYDRHLDSVTTLTVEGNTSPIGAADDVSEREGDGLYRKTRRIDRHDTRFIRWGT